MLIYTFVTDIESYLESIGLMGDFGLFFFSMVMIGGAMALMYYLHAPNLITILIGLISLLMFVSFGFLPQWIIFLIGLLMFIILFIQVKGGFSRG